jgi:ketosteroid isomerase-like protein
MAERSPEIEQLMRDMLEAMARSDVATIERTMSHEPYVLGIGSDPAEWVEGYDDVMRVFRESTPDSELGVTVGLDDVTAFSEGTVGWAAGHGYFEIEGRRVPVRMTAVVHQEDGEWRTVQTHASIGVPNDRMFDPMLQDGA